MVFEKIFVMYYGIINVFFKIVFAAVAETRATLQLTEVRTPHQHQTTKKLTNIE